MLIIALCGYPDCGKSTLQDYLAKKYGFEPYDDAIGIRQEAMKRHNLTWDDVSTQAGKAKNIETPQGTRQVRDLLADIGNEMIGHHGSQWKPEQALAAAKAAGKARVCFASVRLDEAKAYRAAGGVVLEVVRPGCAPLSSADEYDRKLVDATIMNDADLSVFFNRASAVIEKLLPIKPSKKPCQKPRL